MATTQPPRPAVYLITGIPASGKSTVAQTLAERLPRSVHLRGDLFRRMIINDREEMTPELRPEAVRQSHLRYELTAAAADRYAAAGFTVVAQDVILGEDLARMVGLVRSRPLLLVVLAPDPVTVAAREEARPKDGYHTWGVFDLDRTLRRDTPRIGLWIDSTDQHADQTVDEILDRAWSAASVP